MRKPLYAFAIAAVAGLASLSPSASAAPAVGALALGGAAPLVDGDGMVHKVHGWHCGQKRGRYAGQDRRLHRHPDACVDRGDDHDFGPSLGNRDSYLYDYSYSPRVRPYNRYRRPLAGRDLYPYLRLKYGRQGWGGGQDD